MSQPRPDEPRRDDEIPAWWSRCRTLARAFAAIAEAPSIDDPDPESPAAPAVFKFGGSCLRDAGAAFARIADLVRPEPRPVVVVLSALHGVTSALERAFADAARRGVVALEEVAAPHRAAIALLPAERRDEVARRVDALLAEVAECLAAVAHRRRGTAAERDLVLAFGERAVVAIGAALLGAHGIEDARALVAEEAGLLTNARAGDASIVKAAAPLVRASLGAPGVHVVAGFVGRSLRGRITTLGRGGSDYTAAYVAGVFGCPTVLFKDTPGVCAADPRAVPGAPVVSYLGYEEAILLGRLGAQVVFEKAALEAARTRVPIVVRAFEADDPGHHPGTIIGPALAAEDRGSAAAPRPRALACTDGVELGAEDERGGGQPLARLVALDGARPVDGEARAVVFGRGRRGARRASSGAGARAAGSGEPLALVSIVGEADAPAGARVLECLGRADVAPIAIGEVAGGAALAVVVARDRAAAAMRALHDGVVLAPPPSPA